jgi:endonuclease/exonuclease/phosphatase family metal-dependent hydrolase
MGMMVAACTDDVQDLTPTETAQVRVMQFNIEYGGTLVDFDSVPAAIEAAGADVVALQEAYGNTCRVAKAAGWEYCDVRTQTISRYPLITPQERGALEVLVAVEPGQVFAVINVHLSSAGYGPNKAAAGASQSELVAGERQRLSELQPALDAAARLQEQGVPVVLTGDFNSPSHRDWTVATARMYEHVSAVPWPVTRAVEDAGLIDAYRAIYPDPATHPGLTWPASRPKVGSYNPGPAGKPADRIDMTFTTDDITVRNAEVVGEESAPDSDISVEPWPGDHRGVVTTLEVPLAGDVPYLSALNPIVVRGEPIVVAYHAPGGAERVDARVGIARSVQIPLPDAETGVVELETSDIDRHSVDLVLVADDSDDVVALASVWVRQPGDRPVLDVGDGGYAKGEPIKVSWYGAPGNKWDWLGVYRRGADPDIAWYKLWTYTGATISGRTVLDDGASGGPWPLPPGKYDVLLLADDSYKELARRGFIVEP